MNLLNVLLKALLTDGAISALAKKTGIGSAALKKLLPLAIPLLLKALTNNASSQSGVQSLLGALTQHTSKKSMADQIAEADQADGSKILGHILGKERDASVAALAKQSGLSSGEVSKALGSIAPALLSSLGSAASSAKGKVDLSDGLDLSDLAALLGGGKNSPLSGLFGGKSKKAAKDNALNGNNLLQSLVSFMG
jgi:hypothetical protein